MISELSYRFIENPLRKFHYKDTFRTVRNWFSKPVISRQKPWLLPGLLVSLVALYGIATAPVNCVDAYQQQLKKILLPIKSGRTDTKNANGSDTESTGENSSKATEAEQSVMEKYGLTEAQVKKAEELEITAFGDSVMLDATADLQEIFPKAVVDGDVGRQLYESPELIKALKGKDLLRDTVLIGLGTNGSFTETQFDNLMKRNWRSQSLLDQCAGTYAKMAK